MRFPYTVLLVGVLLFTTGCDSTRPVASYLAIEGTADVAAGAAMSIRVRVLSDAGEVVGHYSRPITLTVEEGPVSPFLWGDTTVVPVGGVASFNGVSLRRPFAAYRLRAYSQGLNDGTSTTFAVSPGPAVKILFMELPRWVKVGAPITPAPTVGFFDAYDNLTTLGAGSVSLRLGTNPTSATLSGTTTRAPQAGVATFSDLVIDKTGQGHTLLVSHAGMSDSTRPFTVALTVPTKLAFLTQPTDVVSGQTFNPPVRIAVLDSSGTLVPDADPAPEIWMAWQALPGAVQMFGFLPRKAVNGIAVFDGMGFTGAGRARLLTEALGLAYALSDSFTVKAP